MEVKMKNRATLFFVICLLLSVFAGCDKLNSLIPKKASLKRLLLL